MLSKSLIVGALSTVGWLLGLVPGLYLSPADTQSFTTIEFESSASAQTINSQQVNAFVRATLEIELAREATLQRLQGINQSFECNMASGSVTNINSVPTEIRQPIVSLCNQSQSILHQNRLSATKFGQIKKKYEANPQQYPQITAAFASLCPNSKYRQLQICR